MMGAAGVDSKTYIEDVFSTYLYTGNGSTQTIDNGIDLAGKGGLVWIKSRSTATDNALFDTARGASNGFLRSNTTDTPYANPSSDLTSFDASGFSITNGTGNVNVSSRTYASWTFRKAAKFFDVVTYTGNGSNRTIAHNLGSVPGCIIVKCTSSADSWYVYHRSLAASNYLFLNSTSAAGTANTVWNNTAPTSTVFSVGVDGGINAPGATYVAYLFAHDTTADGMIQCGSYTGTGSNVFVPLGWEPQWVLTRAATWTDQWDITDTMRGMPVTGLSPVLFPNLSSAESNLTNLGVTSTGFNSGSNQTGNGQTYIYIAIRRGPMKTPTSGASVFQVKQANRSSLAGNIREDLAFWKRTDSSSYDNLQWGFSDRIRGISPWTTWTTTSTSTSPVLYSHSTAAEVTNASRAGQYPGTTGQGGGDPNAISVIMDDGSSASGAAYFFRRAPGFFDVVAYTGNGSSQTLNHNLNASPELIIVKARNTTSNWRVGSSFEAATYANGDLNNNTSWTTGVAYGSNWFSSQPTATSFGVTSSISSSSTTYIAYLFASCPGVSKVGFYTGTGTTLQINCGFTNGARFVLIKRTDSTGDWYVWDTARGIVAANDPYLLLNSSAAEVTNTDYIDPYAAGFEISSTAPAAINALNGSYIYLAIA